MLARWFDLYLYCASGFCRLDVKVPAGLIDDAAVAKFASRDVLVFERRDGHLRISWRREDTGSGWLDDDAIAAQAQRLAGVRQALMNGELWPLYLGWLAGQRDELEPDKPVAVPPGLRIGDRACFELVELLGIDVDLVAAVAEVSAAVGEGQPQLDAQAWLDSVPATTKDAALLSLLRGEPGEEVAKLRQQLALARRSTTTTVKPLQPSFGQLRERAKALAAHRVVAEAERAIRQRAAHLDEVAKQAKFHWQTVFSLRDSQRRLARYKVVETLLELRDAADHQGARAEFEQKLAVFLVPLGSTRALYTEMVAAKLIR